MRVLSENDANNVDVFNEEVANDHGQEVLYNDLSQITNLSDLFSHDPQEYLKEKATILPQSFIEDVHELKSIPQVMNVKVNLKIQYLQLNHPRVYFNTTHSSLTTNIREYHRQAEVHTKGINYSSVCYAHGYM